MASTNIGRQSSVNKAGGRRNENNKLYALPLPIELEHTLLAKLLPATLLGLSGIPSYRIKLDSPSFEGVLDEETRSVWVENHEDCMMLWRRGFFGKGHLSRSEPTWFTRYSSSTKAKTAEEMTARRRAERKQFKLDRAAALAAAARDAEIAFIEGRAAANIVIPSAATWKPTNHSQESDSAAPIEPMEKVVEEDNDEDHAEYKTLEHLRLTLQEAFFLAWALGCLNIRKSSNGESMSLTETWFAFQNIHSLENPSSDRLLSHQPSRFDNPFLINYVIYHHYRSLGWVVKSGIKFCVDLLLYKRGPVFHHAEFAIVVCPVYEDLEDEESSPYNLQNTRPFSWSWLSTINRVNTQVQKTLVLSYVTIPAMSKLSTEMVATPACLNHYSVREVILRRFIPARMRG